VDFAISIPQQVADGTFDPAAMRGYLTRAEELGFTGAWTQEHIFGTAPLLGPVETLTYAAACTQRLRLGCAVFITPLHSPVHLAKSLSTLDQLSRGRLDVGVGTGGRGRMFSAFGVDPDSFVARFTEGLQLMRELWTKPTVTFTGRFWQLDSAAMEPKPFQKPTPPVWFGGHARTALRRAVSLGDGFFGAGSATTKEFAKEAQIVREELATQGRDPASFPIAKRVYVAVDDDAERARQRMTAALGRIYGEHKGHDLLQVAVLGPPDTCVRELQAVADAGAGMILFSPLFDEAGQMERLAAQVMPRLSGPA
jgi:probable F420-dependent oxidoreductase